MIEVETLEPENQVLTLVLGTLARKGYIAVEGMVWDEGETSETTLHFALINYLYNALTLFLKDEENCFVAANLRISYNEKHPLKWYAPDVLAAFGVENRERTSYHLPTEKVMPQVIFEVVSEQTADKDVGEKYLTYSRLGVEEYYLLDPERALLPEALTAYQGRNGKLKPVKIENGRVSSPRLELEIVDTGENFRLFDPATNEFLRSTAEIIENEAALARRVEELEALLKHQSK